MKKLQFYKQTALSMGTTLALATALALGFTACDKDDDKNSDGDLYVPSKDMTNDEIRSLFEEVNANMGEAAELSMEMMEYNGQTLRHKYVGQFSVSQEKSLEAEYEGEGNSLGAFSYVENFTKYEYESASYTYNGKEVKRSYKVTDAYWNDFGTSLANLVDEEVMDNLQWQVEGNTFVASVEVKDDATMKMTVTITTSKKVGSIKVEVEEEPGNNGWRIIKFTYSANPVLPSGFATSDFPAVTGQRSLKVVWGEGLGENIFYTYPGTSYISPYYDIFDYAPRVQGKKVQALYYNSNFTGTAIIDSHSESILLQNDNTVLYAKWGSASSSTAAAKSPERAASKRKFPLVGQ